MDCFISRGFVLLVLLLAGCTCADVGNSPDAAQTDGAQTDAAPTDDARIDGAIDGANDSGTVPTEVCLPTIANSAIAPRELGPESLHASHDGCLLADHRIARSGADGRTQTTTMRRRFVTADVLVEESVADDGTVAELARYFLDVARNVFWKVERGDAVSEQTFNAAGRMTSWREQASADYEVGAVLTWDGDKLRSYERWQRDETSAQRVQQVVATWEYDGEGRIVVATAAHAGTARPGQLPPVLPERTRHWAYDTQGRPVSLAITIGSVPKLELRWTYGAGPHPIARELTFTGGDHHPANPWTAAPWGDLDSYEGEWLGGDAPASTDCVRLPVRIEQHMNEPEYRLAYNVPLAPGQVPASDVGVLPFFGAAQQRWLTEYNERGAMVRQEAQGVGEAHAYGSFVRTRTLNADRVIEDALTVFFDGSPQTGATRFVYNAENALIERVRTSHVRAIPLRQCTWSYSAANLTAYQCRGVDQTLRRATFDAANRLATSQVNTGPSHSEWRVEYAADHTISRYRGDIVHDGWGLYSREELEIELDQQGRQIRADRTITAVFGRRDGVPPDVSIYTHTTEYDERGHIARERYTPASVSAFDTRAYIWDEAGRLVQQSTLERDGATTTESFALRCR